MGDVPVPACSGTIHYQYEPLDPSVNQIRLAELLPGTFEDDIRLNIHVLALPWRRVDRPAPIWNIEDIQKSLDEDWIVRENLHGRFIFEHKNPSLGPMEAYETSYTHPNAGVRPLANNYNFPPVFPQYEALSHVWGSSIEELVFVEPVASSAKSIPQSLRHIFVRRDLAVALRHLRRCNRPRLLWVDNICIDQHNPRERSRQVQQMGLIYQSAHSVVVWLGAARDNSQLAMSTLAHIGEQVEITNGGTWRVNAPGCVEPTWSRIKVALPYDIATWNAVATLLHRPWFERVWVWQEVKLSSDRSIIQCGCDEISLYTFCRAAWCAYAKANILPIKRMHYPLFRAAVGTMPRFDEPFLHLLLHLGLKECWDPRDKIYGALGLAPLPIADMITVNYDRAVHDVYKDGCVALLHTTRRVDFLIACSLATRTFPLPTWVPDFHSPPDRSPKELSWLLSTTQASGISEAAAKVSSQGKPPSLFVHGVLCGEVSTVGPRAPGRAGTNNELCTVIRAWSTLCPAGKTYINGEPIFDAFVKAIHWNILHERCPQAAGLPNLDQARAAIWQAVAEQSPNSNKEIPWIDCPESREAVFLTTAEGHIGITSSEPQLHDVVFVMLGCPQPLILRAQGSSSYSVVGAAYLHGVMDAESLLGPLGDDWVLQSKVEPGRYGGFAFYNKISGEHVNEDPRLGTLPPEWVRLAEVRESTDPQHFVRFRHLVTGKTMNGDPRLLPDALTARGVRLQTIELR